MVTEVRVVVIFVGQRCLERGVRRPFEVLEKSYHLIYLVVVWM